MTSLTLATADFGEALRSVAVHASSRTQDEVLHRIRCTVDPQNLTLTATNRQTAGLAIASIEKNHDGELASFDLSPTDASQVLSLFKGRHSSGEELGDTIRLDVDIEHFTITDTGGLFEGKSLTLPRQPGHGAFPDIPQLVSRVIARRSSTTPRLVTNGALVALFATASRAYGEQLVLEPTGSTSTLLVACGESFLGLLLPNRMAEGDVDQLTEWRSAWHRRLPPPDGVMVEGIWALVDLLRGPRSSDEGSTGSTTSASDPAADDVEDDLDHADDESSPPPEDTAGPVDDELLEEAARLVIESQLGSSVMLGRKLRIRRTWAIALMRELEDRGVVGPAMNGRTREVRVPAGTDPVAALAEPVTV